MSGRRENMEISHYVLERERERERERDFFEKRGGKVMPKDMEAKMQKGSKRKNGRVGK